MSLKASEKVVDPQYSNMTVAALNSKRIHDLGIGASFILTVCVLNHFDMMDDKTVNQVQRSFTQGSRSYCGRPDAFPNGARSSGGDEMPPALFINGPGGAMDPDFANAPTPTAGSVLGNVTPCVDRGAGCRKSPGSVPAASSPCGC